MQVLWFGSVAVEAVNVAEAAGKVGFAINISTVYSLCYRNHHSSFQDLKEGKITNTVHASSRAVGGYAGATYG